MLLQSKNAASEKCNNTCRWWMDDASIQKIVNVIGVKGDASNTHPAFVRAGPRPAEEVYSLKY